MKLALITLVTDLSRWSEVVDEILESHDDLSEADVLPESTVASVRTQRLQRSEHAIYPYIDITCQHKIQGEAK